MAKYKCILCNKKIETNELGKIKGIFVKIKGKLYVICSECQKKYGNNAKKVAMEKVKK